MHERDGSGEARHLDEAARTAQRYELIASQVRDVVLFMRRDDGRILEANEAAVRAYGYRRDELLAMRIQDLRAAGTEGLTAVQMAEADLRGVLFETVHRRKDGTTFPVEVSSRGATVDGVRTLVSVVRDIGERRRAEAAASRREAQLQGVVEGLSEGLIVGTLEGELIHWNRAALDLHGFRTVEEVRRRLADFEAIYTLSTLDGRELAVSDWPLPRVMRGEPLRDLDLVLRRRADGWTRIFTYGGAIVRGAEGEPLAILTVSDATERHRVTAELAAERDRLAVTLGSIGDAVVATDGEARITDFNAVAEALTGWTAAEARGRTCQEVLRVVDEETRLPAICPVERVLREGVTVGLPGRTALVARGGAERPIAFSAAPIRDGAGHLVGAVLVFRDQAVERRAEAALRASEAHLRSLAEALPQLVWTADQAGRPDWFNPRWREYTGQAAGQEDWAPVLHPDDRAAIPAMWDAAVAARRVFEVEHRLRRADGAFRWFLRRALHVPGLDGGGRWIGTCTDIHDLKESQQLLRQADRLKQDFLSMASHELRTPLTALHLQAELLRRDLGRSPAPDALAEAHLAGMENQLARLDKLIGLLLDAACVTEGRLLLEPAEVDLGEVVGTVVERFRPEAVRLGCTVHLRARRVVGRWDPHRLDQVVANLLGNALKYGNRRPVEVDVDERGDRAVLVVRDRGVGIPPDSLVRIFQRFERGSNVGRVKGLGLGLWIARQLVELHGGTIAVDSTPGEGTCFTVALPRAPPVPAAAGDPAAAR